MNYVINALLLAYLFAGMLLAVRAVHLWLPT